MKECKKHNNSINDTAFDATYDFERFQSKYKNDYMLIKFNKHTIQYVMLESFLVYHLGQLSKKQNEIQESVNLYDEISRVVEGNPVRTFIDSPYCSIDVKPSMTEIYDSYHEEGSPKLAFRSMYIPTEKLLKIICHYQNTMKLFKTGDMK